MDEKSQFNLEIRIVALKSRGRGYILDIVVDADFTNFRDLVDKVVDKCPPSYGDIVKLFYSCMDTKTNIPICSDQDLVEMFAKHKASKCCYLTFCYHSPGSDPPKIHVWDVSSSGHSVEAPFTPSMPCPSLAEPSLDTHTLYAETTEHMANPNPCSEFQNDGEGLYIDLGPQNSAPVNPHMQQKEPETSQSDGCYDSEGDDESFSDEEDIVEDIDEVVEDRLPLEKSDANYDKSDPPMAVGTLYSNMDAFKLALGSHATKYEFHYNIKKSDKTRHTVYCSGKNVGCRWRLHASVLSDGVTVKVIFILSLICIDHYFFFLINHDIVFVGR